MRGPASGKNRPLNALLLTEGQTSRTPSGKQAEAMSRWIHGIASALATASGRGRTGAADVVSSQSWGGHQSQPVCARRSRSGNTRLKSRMRENRTYGSEGGEAKAFPTPIRAAGLDPHQDRAASATLDARFRA